MTHPVRQARERLLLTQRDLARKAGVALRTVHSVEQYARVRRDTKRKILRALVMPLEAHAEMFPAAPAESSR